MDRIVLTCWLLLASVVHGFSQKTIIDSATIQDWPSVDQVVACSKRGEIVAYNINNFPTGSFTMYIRDMQTGWVDSMERAHSAVFTNDSKYVYFRKGSDSLGCMTIGGEVVRWEKDISDFNIISYEGRQILVCHILSAGKTWGIVLRDLCSNEVIDSIRDVDSYEFFPKFKKLLLLERKEGGNVRDVELVSYSLVSRENKDLWDGRLLRYSTDKDRGLVTFISEDSSRPVIRRLWLCQMDVDKCVGLWNSNALDSSHGWTIDRYFKPVVSKDGRGVFFRISYRPADSKDLGFAHVDVWSYRDAVLQEQQIREQEEARVSGISHFAYINLATRKLTQVDSGPWNLTMPVGLDHVSQYVILTKGRLDGEIWWMDSTKVSAWLYSLTDGWKVLLKDQIGYSIGPPENQFYLSPDEQHVVYFDPYQHAYFSYDVHTGISQNITKGVLAQWDSENDNAITPMFSVAAGIAGWIPRRHTVLLYDRYDIWEADLDGHATPRNITHGFGGKNLIQLKIVRRDREIGMYAPGDLLFMKGVSTDDMYEGFYEKRLDSLGDPVCLNKGPYRYEFLYHDSSPGDTWIMMRETAHDAPNIFLTADFRRFSAVSDIKPQQANNRLSAELIRWKMLDGAESKGMLFKPIDFDSTKKYPILFNYYLHRSSTLFQFLPPGWSDDNINIPYFVCRGYVVFVPDILCDGGRISVGVAAENSVISAANFLKRYSWVDSNRMGLQGHSLGGFETNYLITHTHQFRAAVEAAGACDIVGMYGRIVPWGASNQSYYEIFEGALRCTLWHNPIKFINESPIFRADAVRTPLLMMHNKLDQNVPWAQGVEWFTALRRLGKLVWMLQYDDGNHSLRGDNSKDYTRRMEQFFGYYLKNGDPPKWMTVGLPPNLKGLDTGMEPDTSGKVPQ